MRYLPQRARKTLDLASLFKICPQCLGDLVARSDFAGDYFCCLQCNVRTDPKSRIGRLPDLTPGVADPLVMFGDDSFPGTGSVRREVLLG